MSNVADAGPSPASKQESPKRSRRWVYVAVGVVLAALLVALLMWLRWVQKGRFYVVSPGQLYRSAVLPPEELIELCRAHGIRTVIDFRKQKDLAKTESLALSKAGVKHVHLPSKQAPDPEVVAGFLKVMDDPEGRPVLIHCTHGVGRAGLFAAIYRMEYQGWPNAKARSEARLLAGFDSFGKDTEKGRFILNYTPRSQRNFR